jgi:Putative dehydrogenase domain of multifunctional non-ribosomal peptide synthetases and related enzymes
MTISTEPVEWYRDKVVLLTGATGNLGGCLMYKLAIQLPTSKIYVLCRGSMRQAMEKWEASMPEQIDEILDTGKIHCLTGDITLPNLGLGASELDTLQKK